MAGTLRLDPEHEHEAMLAELAKADGVLREAFDLVDTRDAELVDRLARG